MARNPPASASLPATTLVAVLLILSACRGERPLPSEPGNGGSREGLTVFARATTGKPAPQPSPMRGVSPGLSALVVVAGDTTDDVCQIGEFCAIQGQAATGTVGVTCQSGPGTCGSGSYEWSIQTAPPYSTTTFTPDTTVIEQPSRLSIQTSDSTRPGVYHSTLVPRPLNGSPPPTPSTIAVTVHVLCSYNKKSCPKIEILDSAQTGAPVVSAPVGQQNTLIGKHVRLVVRWKDSTGTPPYPYTVTNVQWFIPGTMVKSYNLSTGTLDTVSAGDLNGKVIPYYWVTPSTAYTVQVQARLIRADSGQVSFPLAKASYRVQGPAMAMLASTTTVVQVGPVIDTTFRTGPFNMFLSFGTRALPGIHYTLSASPPSGDNGLIVGTQLINSQSTYQPAPPADSLVFPSTNGTYWLDNCSYYPSRTGPVHPDPTTGQFLWETSDAPGSPLTADFDFLKRVDALKMYFMYRPAGDTSSTIWVPLKVLPWHWWGQTTRDPISGTWTPVVKGNTADWSPDSLGTVTTEFPQWANTLINPKRDFVCQ